MPAGVRASIGLIGLLLAALAPGCGAGDEAGRAAPGAPAAARRAGAAPEAPAARPASPAFVGTARCSGCHAEAARAWRGSDHDRAMEPATPETVLGDFADAALEHFGVVSRFFRREGRYVVRTQGPDGALHDYEVAYTFGVDPLQQYLVRFPGGRLQVLPLAWDARPAEAGGGRWLHLPPDEPVPPGDPLHWTGLAGSWNSGCASCHSTGLRKGWDPAAAAFATSWSDLDVGCEACHGHGSRHVAWAEAARDGGADAAADEADALGLAVALPRRGDARWVFAEGAAIARREPPLASRIELDVCAPCHARRSLLREAPPPGAPLLDGHRPALLEPGLYHADGQIEGEVYEYGSFVQSRMHAAGVTCSDCHEPHGLALRAEGNALCGGCHRPEAFDVAAHHHHEPHTPGAACVSCHMPARTYMVVDARRDHGFRVPRPDLAASLGVPDACTGCHAERTPAWAAARVAAWFPDGRAGTPHWSEALAAGRRRAPDAAARLAAVAGDASLPGIVRATALAQLAHVAPAPDPALIAAVRAGSGDPDPLVRLGALAGAEPLPPPARAAAAAPRLRDPLRAVRIEAARLLADAPPALLGAADRTALADALAEYRASQRLHAERPEAHVNLGLLDLRLGELDAARRAYETALRLAPWYVPAWVNLADLERAQGREPEEEALLRRALAVAPEDAAVHHALALARIRAGRPDEALPLLERAAALAPDEPRHGFVLALALHERGRTDEALARLEALHARHGPAREVLLALATIARDAGRTEAARRWARVLADARPGDAEAAALLAELERAAAAGSAERAGAGAPGGAAPPARPPGLSETRSAAPR